MEDISQSEYNQRFLDRLAARRPDLLNMVEKAMHGGIEYVKIEIPPPTGQEDGLVVSTYGSELTIFYHAHHTHFDMFADGDAQAEFDECFEYVEALMKEEIVVVSEFDGERWCSSCDSSADEPIEPKENRKVIVRSWKGTHSRTIEQHRTKA